MTFYVQRPGAACPWRSLQEMLRDRHEATRAVVAESIAQRERDGAPTDDRVDWRAEMAAVLDDLKGLPSRADVVKIVAKAHAIANGGLQPMGPYVDDPEITSVEVRIRALSKGDVIDMRAEMTSAEYDGDDPVKKWEAMSARLAVMRPFLAKALVGVRGLEVDAGTIEVDGLTPEHPDMGALLDALDSAGVMSALFVVARDLQDLSPLQRRGFGLPHPSTSGSSSAASAQPSDGASSGATAEHLESTSLAIQIERQTAALGVTHSTTHSSETHSTSTG